MRKWLLSGILLCSGLLTQAQQLFQLDQRRVRMDVFPVRHVLLLPVYINGNGPYNFILDTGAGYSLITDPALADTLGLPTGRPVELGGWGSDTVLSAYLTYGVQFSAPHLQSHPMSVLVLREPLELLDAYLGVPVAGILGYEFFSSFRVELYRKKHKVQLTTSHKMPGSRYAALPLSFLSNKPYVECRTGPDDRSAWLLMDTGAGFALSLPDAAPEPGRKAISTGLGVGLGGPVDGLLSRSEGLGIGPCWIPEVLTAYPQAWGDSLHQRPGIVGNLIWERFRLIIDYREGMIWIRPGKDLTAPFPYDRSGMQLLAASETDSYLEVAEVRPGSPAAEVDILPGDRILSIDNQKISELSIDEIDQRLADEARPVVWLELNRNGEILLRVFSLRDPFAE